MRPRVSPQERFWSKVDRRGDAECWGWKASVRQGHGWFRSDGRGSVAHRWSYEQVHGPIPDANVLRRRCNTVACVNPDHYEIVCYRRRSQDERRVLAEGRAARRAERAVRRAERIALAEGRAARRAERAARKALAKPPRPRPNSAERFWSKVGRREEHECWEWQASKTRNGYGWFKADGEVVAHRWSFVQARGPIPPGLTLDHLCRNRGCVNPAHLEIVTPKENVLRGVGLSAANARKTHCVHGHPFNEENTYFWRDGASRICKTCLRERERGYLAARKTKPHSRDRTHCPRGHEYAGENLYTAPDGRRSCRTCERAKQERGREQKNRRWRERQAAKRAAGGVRQHTLRGAAAANARKDVCKYGHPLTEGNFYRHKRGARLCKECIRIRNAAYSDAKRSAGAV